MTDPKGTEPRHELTDLKAIHNLSVVMLKKMRENKHKAHWSTVDQKWLLNRCMDEVRELQDALINGTSEDIIKECADVANFAMMIADNAAKSCEANE